MLHENLKIIIFNEPAREMLAHGLQEYTFLYKNKLRSMIWPAGSFPVIVRGADVNMKHVLSSFTGFKLNNWLFKFG